MGGERERELKVPITRRTLKKNQWKTTRSFHSPKRKNPINSQIPKPESMSYFPKQKSLSIFHQGKEQIRENQTRKKKIRKPICKIINSGEKIAPRLKNSHRFFKIPSSVVFLLETEFKKCRKKENNTANCQKPYGKQYNRAKKTPTFGKTAPDS